MKREKKRMLIKVLQVIIKLMAICLVLLGTIFIYDARILTKKFFSFGDQNDATNGFKLLGFILAIFGALIIYFV